MATVFDGNVEIREWQFYLQLAGEAVEFPVLGPGLMTATDDFVVLLTGLNSGRVPVTVNLLETEPGDERASGKWDYIENARWQVGAGEVILQEWGGMNWYALPIPTPGTYRIRYHAANYSAGSDLDTAIDEPAPDYYRIDLWPAPAQE